MQLTRKQVDEAFDRYRIAPLPVGSPEVRKLERQLGRHTFFLVDEGVVVFEELAAGPGGRRALLGHLVGSWVDQHCSAVRLHGAKPTSLVLSAPQREEGARRSLGSASS